MPLPFLEKRKFVLMIGDDGAILALVNKDKIEKRLFSNSSSPSDRREINELLSKYPQIPIYAILDTMEQSYTQQTLPAVGSFAIGQLVKKRLERDFAASDIKGAVPFGRDKEGRHDWIYMFASTPVTSSISGWTDYIASIDNKFAGIYMLPVEMQNFAKQINAAMFKNKDEAAKWEFIVTHNKTGGFRQTILKNSKVVFTRLIKTGKDTLPGIIAGNVEQEILNTLDYMRRLGYNSDEDKINIITILSPEIKKSMEGTKIDNSEVIVFTPAEAAAKIGMKSIASETDKFSDLLIAAIFANSPSMLRLENQYIKSANNLHLVSTLTTGLATAAIPIFIIYSLISLFQIVSISKKVKEVENEKAGVESRWNTAKNTSEYNIEDTSKIIDAVKLYDKMKNQISPLTVIEKTCVPQKNIAPTKSLTWSYEEILDSQTKKQINIENSTINMEFSNVGKSIEELFKNYDDFRNKIRKNLENYKVEISDLPNTITFDERRKTIPVQVKITFPNNKKDNK